MVDDHGIVSTWIHLRIVQRKTFQTRYQSRRAFRSDHYRASNLADYRMRYPPVWNGTCHTDRHRSSYDFQGYV